MIEPSLMPLIAAVMIGLMAIVIAVSAWLAFKYHRLKADYEELAALAHTLDNETREVSSFTLAVNERLVTVEGLVRQLAEKMAELQLHETAHHPYSQAIQKVRSGATVNELMQTSGLSQDEAALLVRLHGSKPR